MWKHEVLEQTGSRDDAAVSIVKLSDEDDYTHRYDTLRVRWPFTLDGNGRHLSRYMVVEAWRKSGWVTLVEMERIAYIRADQTVSNINEGELEEAIANAKAILK